MHTRASDAIPLEGKYHGSPIPRPLHVHHGLSSLFTNWLISWTSSSAPITCQLPNIGRDVECAGSAANYRSSLGTRAKHHRGLLHLALRHISRLGMLRHGGSGVHESNAREVEGV
jgi:hypothetical protein